MAPSLVLYDLGGFDVVQLCLALGLHLVLGWIYLFVSPVFLNRALPKEKKIRLWRSDTIASALHFLGTA